MIKLRAPNGDKNLIADRMRKLRKKAGLSQKELAHRLQLLGVDVDINVIARLESGKRMVNDLELKALRETFQVSYEYLIEGEEQGANK